MKCNRENVTQNHFRYSVALSTRATCKIMAIPKPARSYHPTFYIIVRCSFFTHLPVHISCMSSEDLRSLNPIRYLKRSHIEIKLECYSERLNWWVSFCAPQVCGLHTNEKIVQLDKSNPSYSRIFSCGNIWHSIHYVFEYVVLLKKMPSVTSYLGLNWVMIRGSTNRIFNAFFYTSNQRSV